LVEGSEGAGRFGFEETKGYVYTKPAEGAEVFEQGVVVEEAPAPVAPVVQAVPEPEVVKSPENDNSNDIADIVSKWGAK